MPNIAGSMASAAKMWQIDLSEVRRAKAGGCRAFRNGGKVYKNDLVPWLVANPRKPGDVEESDWKTRKIRAQVEKLELDVAMSRDKVVAKSEILDEWGKLITDLFDILDKSLDRATYNIVSKELRRWLGDRS